MERFRPKCMLAGMHDGLMCDSQDYFLGTNVPDPIH